MNHRLEFERRAVVGDDFTGMEAVWERLGEAWGKIEPLTGRELAGRDRTGGLEQINADLSHKVTTRYLEFAVMPLDRINFGMRRFEIETVINPGEENKWLEMHCKEQV